MSDAKIVCLLRNRRERAGLSQAALAERVGVSRQALIAIEAGRQVPSTGLSLQLARVLGCRVDDLFQLSPSAGLEAVLAPTSGADRRRAPHAQGGRVVVGRVGDRWVAHRIADDASIAADGVIEGSGDGGSRTIVEPLADTADLERNVLVAGCAPLLGVLSQRAGLRYRDARVTWLSANSQRALDLLDAGLVHVAGLHLVGKRSADGNLPALRRRFPDRRMLVVNLTRWRQGFVVPKGNPLAVREASDLLRPELRFARREKGAGATQLTRRLLAAAGAKRAAMPEGPVADGHAAVAELVRCGAADVGVAIEGAAIAAGLDFVPLSEERFDLVLPAERAAHAPVSRLFDLLGDAAFRTEAACLPGYDGSISGQLTALDAA